MSEGQERLDKRDPEIEGLTQELPVIVGLQLTGVHEEATGLLRHGVHHVLLKQVRRWLLLIPIVGLWVDRWWEVHVEL
jgi:hypothetical protein